MPRTTFSSIIASSLSLAIGACTVGPNYKGPPAVAPIAAKAATFHRAPVATVDVAAPPARWWDSMNDPELTSLVDRGLAASPTLAAAQARILQARATLSQSRAALLPSAGASALALKASVPTSSVSGAFGSSSSSSAGAAGAGASAASTSDHQTLSLYSVGFDAMWEIDLFGGRRRNIEGAAARTAAAAARYEDAQVQLAAEIGQAYVQLRDAQARLALGRRASDVENRMLALTLDKRKFGTADDLDVERLRTQLNQTDANNVPLAGQVEQTSDQLAMLIGQEPGTLDGELTAPAALPVPPADVPIGDPAAMLRRRPDIRAAERQLASSNAAIGENIAKLFPTVNLIGNVGVSSGSLSSLFTSRSLSALGLPMLQWNFLDFGKTRGQIRQARAQNDEALAQYRETVLSALQDAEASLSRFGHQRENLAELGQASASADHSAELATVRYRGGTATLIDSLDAERQRLQAEQSFAQAKAQLSIDYIALQKSLGLGWQPLDPLAPAPPRPGS